MGMVKRFFVGPCWTRFDGTESSNYIDNLWPRSSWTRLVAQTAAAHTSPNSLKKKEIQKKHGFHLDGHWDGWEVGGGGLFE